MNPQHVIHGDPAAFAKAANKLIASRDVALSIHSVAFADGRLAAVIEESQRISGSSGALIEISASRQKDPARHLESLRAENPMWRIEAAFPLPEEAKGKPAILTIISLRQP